MARVSALKLRNYRNFYIELEKAESSSGLGKPKGSVILDYTDDGQIISLGKIMVKAQVRPKQCIGYTHYALAVEISWSSRDEEQAFLDGTAPLPGSLFTFYHTRSDLVLM